MKKLVGLLLLVIVAVTVSGCASLYQSGSKQYRPIEHRDAAGHFR